MTSRVVIAEIPTPTGVSEPDAASTATLTTWARSSALKYAKLPEVPRTTTPSTPLRANLATLSSNDSRSKPPPGKKGVMG